MYLFFNFDNYTPPAHKKDIDRDFLEWFIGFSEADGSWIVDNKNNRLFFIINQQQEDILHYIRDNLGYGKVLRLSTHSRFFVSRKQDIRRLISLFSGNLLLKKTRKRFSFWLDFLGNQSERDQCQVSTQQLGASAWLSGFIDGEGCFNSYTEKPLLRRDGEARSPALRFILDQKGERETLEQIGQLLEGGVVSPRRAVEDMWRYTLYQKKGCTILARYLEKHPLRTKKKSSALLFFALSRLKAERATYPWGGGRGLRVKSLLLKMGGLSKGLKEERWVLSSETLSKTTKVIPTSSFLSWFRGFSEGSAQWLIGSIGANKKRGVYFKIQQKEIHFLLLLEKELGFGNVTTVRSSRQVYYRYTVYAKADVLSLIHIFNGNLVLSRSQKRFHPWSSAAGVQPIERSASWEEGRWLAGYIDAKGSLSADELSTRCGRCAKLIDFRLVTIDHLEDSALLHQIRDKFGFGKVRQLGKSKCHLSCTKGDSLQKLLHYLQADPTP